MSDELKIVKDQPVATEAPKPRARQPGRRSDTLSHIRRDPKAIGKLFREGTYPYNNRIPAKKYAAKKAKLQIELLKVQSWVKETGQKIVLIFEGRDAAGKGGTIKRFMEHLNPRAAKVVALEKPTERERGEWYFQRYVRHLPTRGEMLFLDRSWYNRAGVERVMGFCDSHEYLEFMRQCPEFERLLVNSGILLYKFYFSVTKAEQKRRFLARETDPLKQWKLSPIDQASLDLWKEYKQAKEAMFFLYRYGGRSVDNHQVRRQETCTSQLHAVFPGFAGLSQERQARGDRPGSPDCRFPVSGHRAREIPRQLAVRH